MEGIVKDVFGSSETILTYRDYMKALNICIVYEVQNNIEVWRDIPNYENHKASNFGRVRSDMQKRPVILKPLLKGNHLYVSISKNKSRKHIRLDYLIICTYIINPNDSKYVLHKDNNNMNCSPLNLVWK